MSEVPFTIEETGRRLRGGVAVSLLLVLPGAGRASGDEPTVSGFSLNGTTGLANTPTAEILPDRSFRIGVAVIDEKWAYKERGRADNEIYFVSVGFLPRIEVSVRATAFREVPFPRDSGVPSVDRMGSARLLVLEEGRLPALAVGIDDARGTRLFHALYIVATKSVLKTETVRARISAGYGSKALDARGHVLDGFFGGTELTVSDRGSFLLDYDTEKVNAGIRFRVLGRVGLHAALLHLDTLSGGVDWTQGL
jgi:hypothetical protein